VLEGKRVLRQAFKDLERQLPHRVARGMRGLRHPKARFIRIPVAVLSIVGGVFSFLPVLGLWMLPLGLLLLAHDVPFLRKPVGRFTSWGAQRWAKFRRPSLSDEAWRELDRPNLPTPSVAVMSAPDLKLQRSWFQAFSWARELQARRQAILAVDGPFAWSQRQECAKRATII
jgi:hypothetical protein